jgi:hypothetical protein
MVTKKPRVVSFIRIGSTGNRLKLFVAASLLAGIGYASTLRGGQANGELQQKLVALKQSAAENQQKLHRYQWTETAQLTLNDDAKPPTQSLCRYGPDGKVEKMPIGPPPDSPSGGRLKQRVVAKKKEEMKDYMGQVKSLLSMYVPPDPQRMQQAFQAGKASLSATPGAGVADVVFKDYALPGDQMTITFNMAAKTISSVNVQTYMDDPKDAVTLAAQFARLPDGTNYVQQSILGATAKKLQVTTTSSNYQPIPAQ